LALHAADWYWPAGQLPEQAWQLPASAKKPLSQLPRPQVLLVHAAEPFATVQGWSHAPQLPTSLVRSRHAPLQAVVPAGQLSAQPPAPQTWSPAHAWPHEPQLAGSLWRSWQAESLQLTLPEEQVVPPPWSPHPASTPTNRTENHHARFTIPVESVCIHTLLDTRIHRTRGEFVWILKS
jgi:hypothetical protein